MSSELVSKELTEYVSVYADSHPIWMVTLSNGESVYQDDNRPNIYPESAWIRLKIYCEENDLYITDMKIRNKVKVKSIEGISPTAVLSEKVPRQPVTICLTPSTL